MNSPLVAPTLLLPAASIEGSSWHASLALRFQQTARGCRLTDSKHEGPLYVQRPFYPEGADLAHVYVLHPPGGLVSGDRLQLNLQLERNTQVLCTTPGAGRLYRARSDQRLQEQSNLLQLAQGAALEWFPQETIVFPGANASLDTQVELAQGSSFTGWEIAVMGLPANDLTFNAGRLRQRLQITLAGRPVLVEQLLFDASEPGLYHAAAGLRSQPVSGIFVCGPFSNSQLATLDMHSLRTGTTVTVGDSTHCGITRLGNFLAGRYLGTCALQARSCFIYWWQQLRPLLRQRAACVPAIWST